MAVDGTNRGRPKGSPNKLNASVKAMILGALNDVGGQKYLARCAIRQPGAFLVLVGKVLPLQIAGTDENGEAVALSFEWAKAKQPLIEGSIVKDADVVSDVRDKAAAD
jgi:hypothetical protein